MAVKQIPNKTPNSPAKIPDIHKPMIEIIKENPSASPGTTKTPGK
jgi:hypothetical protein